MSDYNRALSALNSIPAGCPHDEWVRLLMAAKAAGLSYEDCHDWSKTGENYTNENDFKNTWKSIEKSGGITAGTLFKKACDCGWEDPFKSRTNSANTNTHTEKDTKKTNNHSINPDEIWKRCVTANTDHPYITRKAGISDGVRVYPTEAPQLIIHGQDVAGYLAVPCWENERLQTLQFIPPNEGKKLNLPGASFNGGFFTVGKILSDGTTYIVEGIGQAWSVWKATGFPAVVCFGSARMMTVAESLRTQYPSMRLMVVPDRGKEKDAERIAARIDGQLVTLPEDKPESYDANDYALEFGHDSLEELLSHAKSPELPLSVIFAHELSSDYIPPDELVEGVLTAGDGSILYGDSNCGKTFFVIDMACALACGVDWFGRKTEPGLIIYLAVESPASVRGRLQAYQKHHDVRVPNFAIVQSPINLFDGETDTDAIIQVVHRLEKQCGQKPRLIIGDTLARLSAGANENAGQDMGLVVRHFDRIRAECKAHFMLIHHCGKNAAAGARGWSGVRAAVDTEIEITDSLAGRCAEITKQRDLDTKGVRIGFRLEKVTLGLTKWKSPATSCVVVPADAPKKQVSKRLSQIAGAIIEYLSAGKNSIKKAELVKHLTDRYSSGAIYREIQKLVDNGQLSDSFGYVRILVPTSAN